jgi:predicted LPLAT superfamily acyltransferase
MSAATGWTSIAERGSLLGMRVTVWFYRRLGKRWSAYFILPIVAYFFLTDRRGRRASRRYLDRLYARPEGRAALGHPPRLGDSFFHYREFALMILDRLSFALGDTAGLEITLDGREHFERLMAAGRGAILLGAHLGSFDALRLLAERSGIAVNVLMVTRHAPRINAILRTLNPAADLRVIHLDPASIQWVFQLRAAVARGEFLAILGDRVGPEEPRRALRVPFLGAAAPFPLGPFVLASTLGCPVLLIVGLRVSATAYAVFAELLAECVVLADGDRAATLQALLAAYARRLEVYCFQGPYQWFNFYDFWAEDAEAGR